MCLRHFWRRLQRTFRRRAVALRGSNRLVQQIQQPHVANGHLAVAQWLHGVKRETYFAPAVDEAAQGGHVEMLQWLHSNQLLVCTTTAMDKAAENGHLEVVKWLHRVYHGCCSPMALYIAVNSGHLELMEWRLHHLPPLRTIHGCRVCG